MISNVSIRTYDYSHESESKCCDIQCPMAVDDFTNELASK